MKKLVKSIINKFRRIRFSDSISRLKKCDVLLFCHDADRGIELGNKAYSPLIDSMRAELELKGFSCYSISHPWSIYTGKRGYGSPIAMNRSYFYHRLSFYVNSLLKKIGIFNFPNYCVYREILKITSPKLIVTIGAPDELCFEARRLNIFHVELLHGIGITFIPWGWDTKDVNFLPQGILSLDNISTKAFRPLTEKRIEIKTIPHPFLKRFLDINSGFATLPEEWKIKSVCSELYRKEILVSLNWGYSGDHILYNNILSNGLFYEEIINVMKVNRNILFRFRLHPVQLRKSLYKGQRKFLENLAVENPNMEWEESSRLPYPVVVSSCSGNISMNSFSCYDAASMGVKSLMLCPTILTNGIHQDWFLDLVEEGYVEKIIIDENILNNWVNSVERVMPRLANLEDSTSWNHVLDWFKSKMCNTPRISNQGFS